MEPSGHSPVEESNPLGAFAFLSVAEAAPRAPRGTVPNGASPPGEPASGTGSAETAAPPASPPPRKSWWKTRWSPAPAAPTVAAPPPPPPAAEPAAQAPPAPPKPKKRRRRRSRWNAPAWVISLLVHLGMLGLLALAGAGVQQIPKAIANINASMVDTKVSGQQAEELLHILADPSNAPRDQATGSTTITTAGGVGGIGSGPPSATPSIGSGVAAVSERSSLPGIQVAMKPSGLSLLPVAPSRDLGGGGMIAGDVTHATADIGEALDQLAREILRHLGEHKLTVIWLFDESGSMKDDQLAIRSKFDRVASELRANVEGDPRTAGALTHAIVGFGDNIHYDLEKPTANIGAIQKAIERLRVDETGVEKTMHAVADVIAHYNRLISKDRKMLIVLCTDESGDDGEFVEEARQAAVSRGVPIYVIGRQSLFGYHGAQLLYVDPVTKDHYYPEIRRGPETADVETLQWDGFQERRDEQPSGFAPYELARLTKETGGIYFLLPSEEEMRIRRREQAYSMATLKEYVPDYESRAAYLERRNRSDLRRSLSEIIQGTRTFSSQLRFPVLPGPLVEEATRAIEAATVRLNVLIDIEKRLRTMEKLRDRETEKRWQAAYDLMLAQIVAYQVKLYEYRACLIELVKTVPKPKQLPTPQMGVTWDIGHSKDPKAPKAETEKKYTEALRLLRLVLERHPRTPWSDLAQDTIDRGLSAARWEAHHPPPNPRYQERAKLVPKF